MVIYYLASIRADILQDFDKQPFANKIALVNKEYKELSSCFVIKGIEKEDKLGYIFCKYRWRGLNYYDQVNWTKYFNRVTQE